MTFDTLEELLVHHDPKLEAYAAVVELGPPSERAAHYGVLGMKWGVRRDRATGRTMTTEQAKARAEKRAKQAENRAKKTKARQEKALANSSARAKKAEAKRAKRQNKAAENKPSSSENKPRSVKDMSDQELSELIRRLQMEQQLSTLTRPPDANKGRDRDVKEMLKDVAFDVTKQATTSVGKMALEQALKVAYDRLAPDGFKINTKK